MVGASCETFSRVYHNPRERFSKILRKAVIMMILSTFAVQKLMCITYSYGSRKSLK
jgi:hypothetical protein